MNKKAETKQTKKVKIVKAPKEKEQVSKEPSKWLDLDDTSFKVTERREVAIKPNWKEWKHIPQVQAWQACALSLDIEPCSMRSSMGTSRLYLEGNFLSESEKAEFESRQRVLLGNLGLKENHLCFSIHPDHPNLSEVRLSEFAAWCPSVEWPIPKELAALAKKPDTATAIKSEKQDTNLTQSKQESEETSAQNTTTGAQNKEKKDAVAIADKLLLKDRSRSGVLDEVIGLAIQKAESMHISKVYPELWALAKAKKAPFNGTVKDGGMAYYNYKTVLVRIDKKALEKRLDRLKKKYL